METSSGRRIAIERGESTDIQVNGEHMVAYAGETIAAVLLAADRRGFRRTRGGGALRGLFCGIGVCFDCLVHVEGKGTTRSCVTSVQPGMRIHLLGTRESEPSQDGA